MPDTLAMSSNSLFLTLQVPSLVMAVSIFRPSNTAYCAHKDSPLVMFVHSPVLLRKRAEVIKQISNMLAMSWTNSVSVAASSVVDGGEANLLMVHYRVSCAERQPVDGVRTFLGLDSGCGNGVAFGAFTTQGLRVTRASDPLCSIAVLCFRAVLIARYESAMER